MAAPGIRVFLHHAWPVLAIGALVLVLGVFVAAALGGHSGAEYVLVFVAIAPLIIGLIAGRNAASHAADRSRRTFLVAAAITTTLLWAMCLVFIGVFVYPSLGTR